MKAPMKIPFLDLVSPHRELEEELTSIFRRSLETASFIGGPLVEEFEQNFAHFCDSRLCVGVGSGTDALRLSLLAAGIGNGDVVITVSMTFIATAEAISQVGAIPEFVDIDEQTYTMDPQKLREYFANQCDWNESSHCLISRRSGRRIAAVIPVHLYGQTADMDPILELARQYNLIVIEDACQAHGAKYYSAKEGRWMTAGSIGNAAAFSFYPGKNLGACGEGGAVTTNDEHLAGKVRRLRDHGQARKYYHEMEGYNARLDAIQAGILNAKLPHLDNWNRLRRQVAERYAELLAPLGDTIAVPHEPSWSRGVYHLYVVRTRERDTVRVQLEESGVGVGLHYPIPLHLQKAYKTLGYRQGDLPRSELAAAEVLSLPMYPQLRAEQQGQVARVLSESIPAVTRNN